LNIFGILVSNTILIAVLVSNTIFIAVQLYVSVGAEGLVYVTFDSPDAAQE